MPVLVDGYESFARALFGVFEMPNILETADRSGASFAMVRDHIFETRLKPEVRSWFRALARRLSAQSAAGIV